MSSQQHSSVTVPADLTRRVFLAGLAAAGAALALPGCASAPDSGSSSALPGPAWPAGDAWTLDPAPPPSASAAAPAPPPGSVLPRHLWTRQQPAYTRMTRMMPVHHVTVHHSAGPTFWATDQASTAQHLESVRRYHSGGLGWGDIGYHFAVDRSGRVWECRPLGWQGAHVRDHNEGNVGIVALGNFDQQEPSAAQLEALHRHVAAVMRAYKVPVARLRTHQEWAATACPGRSLQRTVVASRASGRFA